jgi:hypothetical protein
VERSRQLRAETADELAEAKEQEEQLRALIQSRDQQVKDAQEQVKDARRNLGAAAGGKGAGGGGGGGGAEEMERVRKELEEVRQEKEREVEAKVRELEAKEREVAEVAERSLVLENNNQLLQHALDDAARARDTACERLKALEEAALSVEGGGEGGRKLSAADLEAEVQRLRGQLEYAIRLNRELDEEKEQQVAQAVAVGLG